MTLAERAIAEYLESHPGRLITSHEICDEVGCKSEGSVRVLVHRLRHTHGLTIASRNGVYGGYQIESAA